MGEGREVVPEGGHCEVSCMPNPPWEEPCREHGGAVGDRRREISKDLAPYLETASCSCRQASISLTR